MSKKAHSMVVLSELSSLFVKISICDALSSHDLFNDISECVTPTHILQKKNRIFAVKRFRETQVIFCF